MRPRLFAITTAILCALATAAAAQSVPTQVNFAGRLADTDGTPINGSRDLLVKLFDAPTAGAEVWREDHAGSTFTRGMVYLALGATDPLDAGVLDGGPLYLEITIDGTVMSPRLSIGSVPYAVRADVAATADSAGTLGTLAPSDVVTAVTAGNGLAGGGSGNHVTVGLRSCSNGEYLAFTAGGWSCTPLSIGDVSAVSAGTGLVGGGGSGDVLLAANFLPAGGDVGVTDSVARGDHVHDARYTTRTDLSSSGTINAAGNPMDWSRLKGVPAGISDGVDADTQYSAGAGIVQTGTQFGAAFTALGGEAGTSSLVARADHLHDGRYPIMFGRGGGQTLSGGAAAGENLTLRPNSTSAGEVRLADVSGRVSIGGGTASAMLDVQGEIRHNAVYLNGQSGPAAYEASVLRYVVDAPPATVGRIVVIDQAIMDALCRDLDGCSFTLKMINWDQVGQPGNATNASGHLHLSESSRWWRVEENLGAAAGVDGANGVQDYRAWDCFFGDSEFYAGTPNARLDNGVGWSLLNCAGCDYSDTTTTCRLIIED